MLERRGSFTTMMTVKGYFHPYVQNPTVTIRPPESAFSVPVAEKPSDEEINDRFGPAAIVELSSTTRQMDGE